MGNHPIGQLHHSVHTTPAYTPPTSSGKRGESSLGTCMTCCRRLMHQEENGKLVTFVSMLTDLLARCTEGFAGGAGAGNSNGPCNPWLMAEHVSCSVVLNVHLQRKRTLHPPLLSRIEQDKVARLGPVHGQPSRNPGPQFGLQELLNPLFCACHLARAAPFPQIHIFRGICDAIQRGVI